MHTRTLSDIVGSYIAALRKHQPNGPYHLGGWSAGGILAYAIAQQLIAEGEEIASLLFIDSPAPTKGLDRLPERFFEHCTATGIFGNELMAEGQITSATSSSTKVPDWLMPHFKATIELLHEYVAPPMAATSARPKVTLIWAGSSPFDQGTYDPMPEQTADDRDTEGMKFLTKQRDDFGAGDWATLFPGTEITCHVVDDEHHFSMMRGEGAKKLTGFIRQALGTV